MQFNSQYKCSCWGCLFSCWCGWSCHQDVTVNLFGKVCVSSYLRVNKSFNGRYIYQSTKTQNGVLNLIKMTWAVLGSHSSATSIMLRFLLCLASGGCCVCVGLNSMRAADIYIFSSDAFVQSSSQIKLHKAILLRELEHLWYLCSPFREQKELGWR